MEELLFPYKTIRKTQDLMIERVKEVLKDKKSLIIHAPTGIGKTAAVIAPSLSFSLKNNLTTFFITPKHSQHQIAIETLKKIKNEFKVDFKAVDLIGKKWMCPIPGTNSLTSPEFNEYCREVREKETCQFYMNSKNKTYQQLTLKDIKDPLHVEELCKLCEKNNTCPFEMACLLAKEASIIIADYYHILSPSIRDHLFKKANKSLDTSIIIIDEAQNIPSRARDLLTSTLSTYLIELAIKEAKQYKFTDIIEKIKNIENALQSLAKKIPIQDTEILIKKEDFYNKIDYYEDLIEELTSIADEIRQDKKRSFIGSISNFLDAWPGQDKEFARILSKGFLRSGRPFTSLSYNCLDPSLITKPIITNSHSTIIMSGTLTPTDMYQDLLGFENPIKEELQNPFPKENRLNLIVPETTTKFTQRNQDMYKKIADYCSDIANAVPGNIAIFFPSYTLRDAVNNFFTDTCKKTTFSEQPNMSKSEKSELLEKFKRYKDQGAVLLGVNAGSFSEGIDLPGDLLKAVLVVGLPLSKPNLQTRTLIDYYDLKYQKGWDYAYIFPAITKTLQAAGRCIRSKTDKGVIILLDERYVWNNYNRCFPKDLNFKITKLPEKRIKEFFNLSSSVEKY